MEYEISIRGVQMQWSKQSEHVITPRKSELFVKYLIFFIVNTIAAAKNNKEIPLLQQSCNYDLWA